MIISNVSLAKIVCKEIENADFQEVLNSLDISRSAEAEKIEQLTDKDIENIINNFKCQYENKDILNDVDCNKCSFWQNEECTYDTSGGCVTDNTDK